MMKESIHDSMYMKNVPKSLRVWFVIHFVVDMVFAIPMMVAPEWVLSLSGLTDVADGLAGTAFLPQEILFVRLVAAALFGIGGVSLWVRDESKEVFVALLKLKVIWSGAAIVALVWALLSGVSGVGIWLALGAFVGFAGVWWYWLGESRK